MVGTGLGSVAVMAARLHSTHRWAVTGTPIGPGGLDDIQGLLRVLHHDPFMDPLVWKWCVANPYLTGKSCCWFSYNLHSIKAQHANVSLDAQSTFEPAQLYLAVFDP